MIRKIKKDIQKSGFASELNVRKILYDHGWSLSGGSAYFDKDENKSREIDIISHRSSFIKHKRNYLVRNFWYLFVEVKKTEKPWIVFKKSVEEPFDSCAWNNLINSINLPCKPRFLSKSLRKHSLLKANGWEGTGIHEAFKNPSQPSQWYKAFLSACKAAEAYKEQYGSDGNKVSDDIIEDSSEISFHQPIVVLDGVLASAELDENNQISIEEVKSAAFKFQYKTLNYKQRSYRVDLVTVDGLIDYIELIKKRQSNFTKELLNQINKEFDLSLNSNAMLFSD